MRVDRSGSENRPSPHWLIAANVIMTGILLGLLQWTAFFTLQSYVSATAFVYFLSLTAWLGGSLVAVSIPGRPRLELLWIVSAIAACYGLRLVATWHPYEMRYLPALLALVAVMGAYAGQFFRYRAEALSRTKYLFFLENCGFIAGTILTIAFVYGSGDSALLTAPIVLAAIVIATNR